MKNRKTKSDIPASLNVWMCEIQCAKQYHHHLVTHCSFSMLSRFIYLQNLTDEFERVRLLQFTVVHLMTPSAHSFVARLEPSPYCNPSAQHRLHKPHCCPGQCADELALRHTQYSLRSAWCPPWWHTEDHSSSRSVLHDIVLLVYGDLKWSSCPIDRETLR